LAVSIEEEGAFEIFIRVVMQYKNLKFIFGINAKCNIEKNE